MYVTNITEMITTNDYDNIADLDTTKDVTKKYRYNENNFDIIVPSLILTIP